MEPLAELGADPLHESWVSTMPTSQTLKFFTTCDSLHSRIFHLLMIGLTEVVAQTLALSGDGLLAMLLDLGRSVEPTNEE